MRSEEIIDSGFAAPSSIRSNRERGRNLVTVLWISLGASVVTFISLLLIFFIVSRGFSGYDAHYQLLENYSIINQLASILLSIVNIVVIVFWILWMRRAYFNLHALRVSNLAYSEGMAAGGWFIPFLSLWIPAQIMGNIWKFTQEQVIENKRLVENGAIVGVWWTLFLLDRFAKSAYAIMSRYDDAQYQSWDTARLYENVKSDVIIELTITLFFSIPLTFAAISMVRKSSKMQNLLYKKERGEEITTEMITGK